MIHKSKLRTFSIGSNSLHKEQGFTLLEVLIAIGITALIGLGAWQVLNAAITSSERTQVHLESLNQTQKAMLIMKRDLSQLIGRSIRDEYGDYQPALDSGSEFYVLQFTRVGWRNPLDDKRSEVQRVAYELDGEKLVRHYWSVLDQTHDSESVSKTLLKGVEGLKFRFMNDSNSWVDKWPGDAAEGDAPVDKRFETNKMPRAIEMELTQTGFGKITRLFAVSEYHAGKEIPKDNGSGGNDDSNNDDSDNDDSNNDGS